MRINATHPTTRPDATILGPLVPIVPLRRPTYDVGALPCKRARSDPVNPRVSLIAPGALLSTYFLVR